MDEEARRIKIRKFIAEYTISKTATAALARKTMIEEGLYTKKGLLRVEFGGQSKIKKVA